LAKISAHNSFFFHRTSLGIMQDLLASVRNVLARRVAPLLLRELIDRLSPFAGTVYRLRRRILLSRLYLTRVFVGKSFKQKVLSKSLLEAPRSFPDDARDARWFEQHTKEESDIPAPPSNEKRPDSDSTTGGMHPREALASLRGRPEPSLPSKHALKPQEKNNAAKRWRPKSNL
jgi:hypothetical protein